MRAAHIQELREAIDAVRALAGLPEATYTDPTIAAGLRAKAAHIQEPRRRLDEALNALGLSAWYSRPDITPGMVIRAADIEEMRNTMQ